MALSRYKLLSIPVVALLLILVFGAIHSEHPRSPFATPGLSEQTISNAQKPIWLIATISPAHALQRRSIIRATWQTLFRNDSIIDTRFVIANPGDRWASVIAHENSTYGDLIILPHLEESAKIANSVKSIELLKLLTEQEQRWLFVSKLDDDSFLDAYTFYNSYLAPMVLDAKDTTPLLSPSAKRTIIGRELHMGEYSYPGGQFYTMTWDLVELLAALHRQNMINDEHEDVLVGRMLYEANERWTLVPLPNQVSFDYGGDAIETNTAWATAGADLSVWTHGVGADAINPHKMGRDEDYLKVAACFGPTGLLKGTKSPP